MRCFTRRLLFRLLLVLLTLTQRALFAGMPLRHCLRLCLVLPFKFLRIAARGGQLRGAHVIVGLIPLEFLPLLFLAGAQCVLLLLIHLVAFGLAGTRCHLVSYRGKVCCMHRCASFYRRRCRPLWSTLGRTGNCCLPMLNLHRGCGSMWCARGCLFRFTRASHDTAVPAIEAYPVDRCVIHGCLSVGVANVGDIHVTHGRVVIEMLTLPMSAIVPMAGIAEPVVDAAIETYASAPVSGIPSVSPVAPAPISGCPQQAGFGWL